MNINEIEYGEWNLASLLESAGIQRRNFMEWIAIKAKWRHEEWNFGQYPVDGIFEGPYKFGPPWYMC